MRVLHVAEAFGGGLLQMVVDLSNGLAAAGHEVVIAHGVRPETPDDLDALLAPGVRRHTLGWESRHPHVLAAGARRLRAVARTERPDVVHLHSSFAGVLGAWALPAGAPIVFTPHAFASAVPESGRAARTAFRTLESLACRRATLVGGVSRSEAEMATARGARRVAWVHNGIAALDPGAPAPRTGPAPGRPLVVAGGRTVAQRRPDACARILAGVRDLADVQWLGGGGGDRGREGRLALEALGIPISGWLPQDEALRRLSGAAAYLHFTSWDGLPYSLLEAVAAGVPVVASDIAPNREVLGSEGLCTTEDEAIALLREVVADPEVARRVREAQGRQRTAFGLQAMVEGWTTVYRGLVPGPAAEAAPAGAAAG